MRKLKLSSLKDLEKFQALMEDGLPEMVRWLKSKRKAKLLMDEVHKQIFDLGPPTPPGRRIGRKNKSPEVLTAHDRRLQLCRDGARP